MFAERDRRSSWPLAAMLLLALWGLLLVAYRDTVRGLIDIWSSSETYAHGAVVPLISLWLVWRIRHTLARLTPTPALSALLLMAGTVVLWMAGDMVTVNVVTHIAFITLVVLVVPVVLGWQVARAMTFPLLFLYFSAPVGDFMLPWLMERTADFTVMALRMTGIPVYREGLQFVIPSGNWSVVEACSGIRYLIASLMVGCLFAYLSYSSARKRWLFMLFALLVPLVANWLRAYLIVMIGHLSGNELATGVDHLIYGWLFFGVVILAMLFVGARWADPAETGQPVSAAPVTDLTAVSNRSLWWTATAAVLVLFAPQLLLRGLQSSIDTAPPVLVSMTPTTPWQIQPQHGSSWVPSFKNPSADAKLTFRDLGGRVVDLGVSYYRQQSRDRKLVSSSNVLVTSNDEHWAQVQGSTHRLTLSGQPLEVQTATLRDRSAGLTTSGQRLRVWRFYWVGDAFTASDVRAKLNGALQLLRGQGDDAAIVVLSARLDEALPEGEGVAEADLVLTGFLQAQAQALRAALRATQGER